MKSTMETLKETSIRIAFAGLNALASGLMLGVVTKFSGRIFNVPRTPELAGESDLSGAAASRPSVRTEKATMTGMGPVAARV